MNVSSDPLQLPDVDSPASVSGTATVSFQAENVTGTQSVTCTFQRSLPAGAVARALAAKMALPTNVPWALRSDSSEFLADEKPIGDQVTGEQERLTIIPKSHLG